MLKEYFFDGLQYSEKEVDNYWFEVIVPFILEKCDVIAITFFPRTVTILNPDSTKKLDEHLEPIKENNFLSKYLVKVDDFVVDPHKRFNVDSKGKSQRVLIHYYKIEGKIKEIVLKKSITEFQGVPMGEFEEVNEFEDPAFFSNGRLKIKTTSHEYQAYLYLTDEEFQALSKKGLPILYEKLFKEHWKKLSEEEKGLLRKILEPKKIQTETTLEEYKNIVTVPIIIGDLEFFLKPRQN